MRLSGGVGKLRKLNVEADEEAKAARSPNRKVKKIKIPPRFVDTGDISDSYVISQPNSGLQMFFRIPS